MSVAEAALTAPATLSANALKATSFTLQWTAATGANGGIAGYDVFQNEMNLGSVTSRSFAVTGLAPLTSYSMTVVARDKSGNTALPSFALIVKTAADTTVPVRPTALISSALTTTSFVLTWTASTDNVGVAGYNIYRTGVIIGSSPIATFKVVGLAPDTNHNLTVRAADLAGNLSATSATLSVRTLAIPPTVPSGLNVANLKAASFSLKWTAATDGTGGIAGYDIFIDGVFAATTTKLNYVFLGLAPLTNYTVTVAARDHAARVSAQSAPLVVTTIADTIKPTVPTGLNAPTISYNSFSLTWTPSSDNVAVTGYDVLKNNVVIGTTVTPAFNVTSLVPSTAYSMRVKARDAVSNISAASAALSVTTGMTPNIPPTVALTSPVAGSIYTSPTSITLAAAASDSDGLIGRVEFFDGDVKLGEALTPTVFPSGFTLPLTLSSAGPHLFTARATDNRNATSSSSSVAIRLLAGLPYVSDFEAAEGYALGAFTDQRGWTVPIGVAQVVSTDAARGEQSILLSAGATVALLDQEFGADAVNPAVVYVDVFVKPVIGTTTNSGSMLDLDNARLSLVRNGAVGQLFAFDGAGAGDWKRLSGDIAIDSNGAASAWQRITVRSNFATKRWDIYLNSRLVAVDLIFRFPAATYFSGLSFQGHPLVGTGLDELYIGTENPLFLDADHDGMDDSWETAHGLDAAVDDRNGDLDGDGLTNIQEYVFGSDPSKQDSDNDGLADLQEKSLGTNPTLADSDGDGIPDGWEQKHGLNPLSDEDAALDPDGDGQTNLQEYVGNTDPNVFYNGQVPLLTIVSGNNQIGIPGQFNGQPILVSVANAASAIPLINAPLTLTIKTGGGKLALTNSETAVLLNEVRLTTDATGMARIYFRHPNAFNLPGTILVVAGDSQIIISTISASNGSVDLDQNGLLDEWELRYFGAIGVDSNADPDGDGIPNSIEFLTGRNPTKGENADAAGAVCLRVYSPNR